MTSEAPASVQRLSIVASILRQVANPFDNARTRWDILSSANSNQLRALDQIFAEYQYRVSRDESNANLYGAAGWIIDRALEVGKIAVPEGSIPEIAKGIVSSAASSTTGSAVDELMKYEAGQTSKWLENALRRAVDVGQVVDLANLKELPSEARLQWLRDERFIDQLLAKTNEVQPEDRSIIEGMVLRALNDKINQGSAIQSEADHEHDEAIAHEAQQIAAVARSLNEFKDETKADIQGIRDKQLSIDQSISKLVENSARDRQDLEFLQMFMFNRMNPNEQLAALNAGMLRNLPADKKARLAQEAQMVKDRQDLVTAVGKFADGASALGRIAHHLHVDPNIVSTIRRGSEIAKVAQTVITDMSSPMGYLAAANAITGLVFGKGPDPAALRQKQIMAALGEISEGISEMQNMLGAMSEQLKAIQKAQIVTYETIVKVSEQIEADHREEMVELSHIRLDLVPIQNVLNLLLNRNIESCAYFMRGLRAIKFDRGATSISYPVLRSTFHDYDGPKCLDGLDSLSEALAQHTYDLRYYKGPPGSAADQFLHDVYEPTFLFLKNHMLSRDRVSSYVKSFAMPVSTLHALALKRLSLFSGHPPTYSTSLSERRPEEILEYLSIPLSGALVDRHARYLAVAHPFFELQEALDDRTPSTLLSMLTTSVKGRELLSATIDLAETAIAQQTMLGGDAALADMDQIWRDGTRPRANGESDIDYGHRLKAWSDLQGVMTHNVTLRRNLILYSVSMAAHEKSNLLVYAVAYGMHGDPSYFAAALPIGRSNLVWIAPPAGQQLAPNSSDLSKSTGWHLKIGDAAYPLPSPIELSTGNLAQTPQLQELLDLRNLLIAEREGYLAPQSLTRSQKLALRQAIWQTSLPLIH